MAMGLQQAANQVQAMGRGPDTQLAHISPDESKFIDMLQGGRRTNPTTGLPEYSMFGNILKAVARAAGAIGGFMVGGPAGAAAGSGAATKLTGGSWKEALGSAALSGIGSWGAQGLTGGGWSPTGAPGGTAAYQNAVDKFRLAGTPIPDSALSSPGIMAVAKSAPGIAAGLGANLMPPTPAAAPAMPSTPGSSIHLNDVVPQPRTLNPYTGKPEDFATSGHVFYSPLNPVPKYKTAATPDDQLPMQFAGGGPVMGLQAPDLGARAFRGAGINPPGMPGNQVMNGPQMPGIGNHVKQMQQAAMLGYQAAKSGGAIKGPGTGTSDSIPAMLSDGEHVIDQATVDLAGGGDNDRGQRVIEQIKQKIRAGHVADPKRPPAFQKGAARAKKRAGMK